MDKPIVSWRLYPDRQAKLPGIALFSVEGFYVVPFLFVSLSGDETDVESRVDKILSAHQRMQDNYAILDHFAFFYRSLTWLFLHLLNLSVDLDPASSTDCFGHRVHVSAPKV